MSRILLVDDVPEFVEAEKAYLTEYDSSLDIETSCDPEAAIGMLEEKPYDLVILDLMMPKKDGLQVLREIKEKFKVPVIIYSSYIHVYPSSVLLEQGASHVIAKPADMEFLINRIRDL